MQLTKRLLEIASLVPNDARVVDVGTDHGYIPIYLTTNKLCKSCIASDINAGPLESAKRHMDKHGITQVELRQGSGLSTITTADQLDVAIVAGMGGMLIIDILRNDLTIVKGLKQLILQPQSNIPEVRKFIHEIGFAIKAESFLQDEGKYYTILVAVPGVKHYQHAYEYAYGKYLLAHPNATYRKWLAHKGEVFQKIRTSLSEADEVTRQAREISLQSERALYEEAMACIQ